MDGTYSVVCEADARPPETFPGLEWKAAEARAECERVKPWRTVTIRCEETGAAVYRYPGTAAVGAGARTEAGARR